MNEVIEMKKLKNEKMKELAADAGRRNIVQAGGGNVVPTRIISFFHLFIFSFLLVSCAEAGGNDSPVPVYNVQYNCNISTINAALGQNDLPHLDSQPGVVMVSQYLHASEVIGLCGLLLYHAATEDVYYAYDLACPYCYQHGRQRQPIAMRDPFVAECPACHSEYGAVQYGSPAPTAGPANQENLHLRQYRARMGSYSTLIVSR